MRRNSALHLLFMVCVLLFALHQYSQWVAQWRYPFLDNYLDPALMMPIVLYILSWERKLLFKKPVLYMPVIHVVCYWALIAFIAEVIFPLFSSKFTADVLDVASYAAGSLIYILVQKIQSVKPPAKAEN